MGKTRSLKPIWLVIGIFAGLAALLQGGRVTGGAKSAVYFAVAVREFGGELLKLRIRDHAHEEATPVAQRFLVVSPVQHNNVLHNIILLLNEL